MGLFRSEKESGATKVSTYETYPSYLHVIEAVDIEALNRIQERDLVS